MVYFFKVGLHIESFLVFALFNEDIDCLDVENEFTDLQLVAVDKIKALHVNQRDLADDIQHLGGQMVDVKGVDNLTS